MKEKNKEDYKNKIFFYDTLFKISIFSLIGLFVLSFFDLNFLFFLIYFIIFIITPIIVFCIGMIFNFIKSRKSKTQKVTWTILIILSHLIIFPVLMWILYYYLNLRKKFEDELDR